MWAKTLLLAFTLHFSYLAGVVTQSHLQLIRLEQCGHKGLAQRHNSCTDLSVVLLGLEPPTFWVIGCHIGCLPTNAHVRFHPGLCSWMLSDAHGWVISANPVSCNFGIYPMSTGCLGCLCLLANRGIFSPASRLPFSGTENLQDRKKRNPVRYTGTSRPNVSLYPPCYRTPDRPDVMWSEPAGLSPAGQ